MNTNLGTATDEHRLTQMKLTVFHHGEDEAYKGFRQNQQNDQN